MIGAGVVADSQCADAACDRVAGYFQRSRGLMEAHPSKQGGSEEVLGEAYRISARLVRRVCSLTFRAVQACHLHLRYTAFLADNIYVFSSSPPQPSRTALSLDEFMSASSLRPTTSSCNPLLATLPTMALPFNKSSASALTVAPFLVAVISLSKFLVQIKRKRA